MVDVAMGYQNGVKIADVRSKCLLPEIYRCIDEDLFVVMLDQDRNAKSFVSRIRGKASFAAAAY